MWVCVFEIVWVLCDGSCDNLRSMVGLDGVTYAGNNGLEVQHPDGSKSISPLPAQYEDNVRALLPRLQEQVCHHGAWVEQKGLLLTYHYRLIRRFLVSGSSISGEGPRPEIRFDRCARGVEMWVALISARGRYYRLVSTSLSSLSGGSRPF